MRQMQKLHEKHEDKAPAAEDEASDSKCACASDSGKWLRRERYMGSCSRVGSGFGLDFEPLGLPLGFGLSASGPPARYSRQIGRAHV